MLKPRLTRLVEELFATGGNHNLEKYKESRKKLIEFLQEEDHVMLSDDDENRRFAKDVIHFIDASIVYAKKTNNKDTYHHMNPFFKRMMDTELNDWDYDELKLLISSIHMTESIEQAIELASKANEAIINFKRLKPTDNLEGALVCNTCSRLLNAKYFNEAVEINLADKFESQLIWLNSLVEKNKNSEYLELVLYVTKIRYDIFNGDRSEIFALCDGLSRYNEDIKQMIISEVDFYLIKGIFD